MWAEGATAKALSSDQARSMPPSVTSPIDPRRRIRAVLFDLDGTLYQQTPMRALMAIELMTIVFRRPLHAGQTWRTLAAYRKTQERLRLSSMTGAASRTQLHAAAERAGLTAEQVEQIVNEWMFERPLKYLRWCRAAGLFDLLAFLDRRGLELGVLSDYPAENKLRALGLAGRFSVVLSSSDPEVGAFKPSPRGFLLAAERWHIDPSEVLVVGDRVEVDARGAAAAGMPCIIIGGADHSVLNPVLANSGFRVLSSLERLRCVLDDDGC
jgi:HAD superfamily hydrolase (TIGR01549 family)